MLAVEPRPARVVHVCEDIACRCNGSDELIAQLEERFGGEGELSADGSTTWYRSPCLGQCDRAPAALVGDAGDEPARADAGADDGRSRARRARRWRARAGAGDRAAAGGRRVAAPASPRRLAERGQPRRVPRPRRLRGASARRRARPGRRDPGAEGLEAAGPRRRSLPDRRQVGGGRAPARAAALPRLQRRRVGARDVQGPGADGARSVRSDRGDDDRRLRDRLRAGVRLHPRRVPRATARARGGDRRGAPARLPRRRRARRGLQLRDRDSQGRGRVHLRRGDGDLRVDRGQPRRAAQQAAVPGRRGPLRQAHRRQQRRDARQRARHRLAVGPGLRRDRHRDLDRHEALLPLGPRRAPRRLRGALRHDVARAALPGRRGCRAARSCSAS